jgi:hypothetical protein
MGLEGIGKTIQQLIALAAVVGLKLAEQGQITATTQPVEPAPTPGAVLENGVQVGARHHTPCRT